MLLEPALIGCVGDELLLGKLVLGGDRFAELWHLIFIIFLNIFHQLLLFSTHAIESNHAKITVSVGASANFLKEAISQNKLPKLVT